MAWVTTYDEILLTIAKNYKDIETSIVNQLLLEVPNHYPTEGSYILSGGSHALRPASHKK